MNIKEIIEKSDYIITFGSFLSSDNEVIKEVIIQAIANNSAEFVYMHPIDNIDLKVYYSQFIKYEAGSEEGIAALLLDTFVKSCDEKVEAYIKDLDIGYISAESSAGEEEFEEAYELLENKKQKTLIVGRDILTHERVENITKILSVIRKYTDLEVISLDEEYQDILNEASKKEFENLEEVEELHSYNGTVVYRTYDETKCDILEGSESFARIAKVANKDKIFINCNGEKIKKTFVVNKDLYGTIALCGINSEDSTCLSQGYRYKQVKIEKADE